MSDNPADQPDRPAKPARRRGRTPRKAANPPAEAAAPIPTAPPAPDFSAPPPVIGPAAPRMTRAQPENEGRPNRSGNGGGQRGYRGHSRSGPRREMNPQDRGPRRSEIAPAAPSAPSAPSAPEDSGQPAEGAVREPQPGRRPNQRRDNGQNGARQNQNRQHNGQPRQNQNRAQNQGRSQNQERGQNQERSQARNQNVERGQPQNANSNPERAQNQGRGQNQNRGQNRGQNQPQNQGPNSGQSQGRQNNPQQQRRRDDRKPRPEQNAEAGQERAASPRGQQQRKSRAVNPFVYNKPPPIKTSNGIKSLSQEGGYALSWWAARWIAAMENLVDGRRLSRGRSYAKEGQVLSMEEKPGGVQAQVQGSRPRPYRIAIEVNPLADGEWEQVFDVLASQALFAAQLLAGEMPRNIEEAFDAAGTSLFPARLGDLHTDCSCPDWANPCKHVAAAQYILAERFDEDPFLLFRLRGRSSEQILTALRERRSAASGEDVPIEEEPVEVVQPSVPLEANLAGFYAMAQPLDDFALSFKAPAIEMPVLKRLGDPNFLGQESLLATMEPVYRAVRISALDAALGEAKEEESAE